MAPKFIDRLAHAWNAFTDRDNEETSNFWSYGGSTGGGRPDRHRLGVSNERSIISAIYTRLSIDVASIDIQHVKLDSNQRFQENMTSGLNNCLTLEANIDQASRQFKQDLAMTLFDKGCLAIVPVDTTSSPTVSGSYEINTMRVGEIVAWFPRHVRVSIYNDRTGRRQEVTLGKDMVAIIENPMFNVMNESNSTLQRLIRKLNILDAVDDASSSGKLDLIIQLPYVVKTEQRKLQAEQRAKDIEIQLKGSKYGIAYTDGTEKITQLNRPAENNMLSQIEYLTGLLFGQLGLTASVLDGTADEKVMLNYHNRTIEPVVAAITQGMKRTFLTKTARTQGQSIESFKDPFKNAPLSAIAEITDVFTRNEILSANEVRGIIGYKPSKNPRAEELINSNMPTPAATTPTTAVTEPVL